MPSTLYILYNADASVMGKLAYGYRKLTSPKDQPACAACDITHGGLHLEETAAWKEAKGEITKNRAVELKQLHRDQLSGAVSDLSIVTYRLGTSLNSKSDQTFCGGEQATLSDGSKRGERERLESRDG